MRKLLLIAAIAIIAMAGCKKKDPKPEPKTPVITITTQPEANTLVTVGSSTTGTLAVTASVTAGATLSYQWYSNTSASNTSGTAIGGATTAKYDIPTNLAMGDYYYFCEVSATGGAAKVRSNVATVKVTPTPVITIETDPANVTSTEGSINGALSVAATVTQSATLSYQWFYYSNSGTTTYNPDNTITTSSAIYDEAIDGATDKSFTIPTTLSLGTHTYYCKVSATGGAASVSSNKATVTVRILENGSADHPFLVNSKELLAKVGSNTDGWTMDSHYKQNRNIEFGATDTWAPIGTTATPFTGTFDGRGYSITGLRIPSATDVFQGLFGNIGTGGAVRNVALKSVNINSTEGYIGGIAGLSQGLIENCYVTGTGSGVSGRGSVGGVVGRNLGGTIKNCYTTCTVKGSDTYVGGITGLNDGGTVTNCYATGNISGTSAVGGIVGIMSVTNTVSTCVALNKEVTATNATGNVGRVAGSSGGSSTLNNNFGRGSMTLKQSTNVVTLNAGDIGFDKKHGATILQDATMTTKAFWDLGADPAFWDIVDGRLPWLKTTDGVVFYGQTPAVTL